MPDKSTETTKTDENKPYEPVIEDKEVHGWYVRKEFDITTYLNHRLRGQLKYFNEKSSAEKSRYLKYQWTLIIGSALTPALVSASTANYGDYTEVIRSIMHWITLIVSVIVGIMAAALKTFKYQENWATTRAVCEMINREKFLYEAGVGEYAHKNRRDALFVERVESLLAREQNQWLGVTSQNNNNEKREKDEDGDGIPDDIDSHVEAKPKKE
jgi:hypothetical protein